MDEFVYYPPRRGGLIFQSAAILTLTLFGLACLWQASQAEVGPIFLAYTLPALLAVGLVPFLIYRIYALQTASYRIQSEGICLRWGLRMEDIPIERVRYVGTAGQPPAARRRALALRLRHVADVHRGRPDLGPWLGALADYKGRKKAFMAAFLGACALLTAGLYFVRDGQWQLALALYGLANVAVTSTLAFYNALLPGIARPEELDRVSTAGFALGYLGGGVLFALNGWMMASPATFGLTSAIQAFQVSCVMVAAWRVVFSIPLFRHVEEPAPRLEPGEPPAASASRSALGGLPDTFRELRRHRDAGACHSELLGRNSIRSRRGSSGVGPIWLADTLPGSTDRPVDAEPAIAGQELRQSLWNGLVLADHEEPAWQETRRDLLRHALLHFVREIGEGQIPAQDEVKRLRGHFDAEILLPEFDQSSKFWADRVFSVERRKHRNLPVSRDIFESAGGVAGSAGTL